MLARLAPSDAWSLCSGQSVVDLVTAVKELVENAIDAKASSIEIILKEYGQVAVEVRDNGGGIPPTDHASIAQKHHTSKIRSFEDVQGVSSFGFRGEALSSICHMAASFHVLTRSKEDAIGTLLSYDPQGNLISSVCVSASITYMYI